MAEGYSIFSRCDWCRAVHGTTIVRERGSRLHYAIRTEDGTWVTFPYGERVEQLGPEFAGMTPEVIDLREVPDHIRGYHTLCASCAKRYTDYRPRDRKKKRRGEETKRLANLPTLFSDQEWGDDTS